MRKLAGVVASAIGIMLSVSAQAALYTTGATGTPGTASSGDGFVVAYVPSYTGRAVSNPWGDTKVGDEGSPNLDSHRTIYKMSLPTLGLGESVDSVTFAYNYFGTASHGSNSTLLANVEVVAYDSATTAVVGSDWDNNASSIVVSPSELVWGVTAGGVRTISGTPLKQAVEQAYTNGRNHVALRFQLAGGLADDGDGFWEVYSLGTSESGELSQRPSLAVTTVVPEPAALGLLGVASLGMLRRRRA